MSRLTQTDDSGNWSLKGLSWKDTYVGQVITENTREKIYGALWKLKDYEESGLNPEQVQKLKERDTAKKPITYSGTNRADCPICGATVRGIGKPFGEFCGKCGQRLKWEA